jgi:glucuronate isomerase
LRTTKPFADPATLLIVPDHYLFRMLYSQGVRLEDLGSRRATARRSRAIRATIWRRFAAQYHLFRGTPSRMWLDWVFAEVFGLDVRPRSPRLPTSISTRSTPR